MANTSIIDWYASLTAKYVDLIGDYAGKERFFIEGDSLLLHCFSDRRLDFDPGFQLLHAVFVVERFLTNLYKRRCIFDIVFFHDHVKNCVPSEVRHPPIRFILARNIIIEHLRNNATQINIFRFQNVEDTRFHEYLRNSACYFALCSDGATYKTFKQTTNQLKKYAIETDEECKRNDSRAALRTTIYKLLVGRGLDVALLNGLTWQDSKVFAFVLERASNVRARFSDNNIITANIDATSATSDIVSGSSDIQPLLDSNKSLISTKKEVFANILAATRSLFEHEGMTLSSRVAMTAITIATLQPKHRQFARAFLVHAICLDNAQLTDRNVSSVHFDAESEQSFEDLIKDFCRSFNALLNLKQFEGINNNSTIVDIIDGRVLRKILTDEPDSVGKISENYEAIIKSLLTLLIGPGNDLSSKFQSVLSTNGVRKSKTNSSAILPFSHPVFDKHLSSINVEVRSEAGCYMGKLTAMLQVWQPTKSVSGSHALKNESLGSDARARRSHQKLTARMTEYSASLTNAQGKCLEPELIIVEKHKDVKTPKSKSKPAARSKKATKREPSLPVARVGETGKTSGLSKPSAQPNGVVKTIDRVSPQNGQLGDASVNPLLKLLRDDGPTLDRSADAKEDPRVAFKPDGWQVKVLDELDQGHSLLVVAPTSAGKTFISFYAMEKVLRANDEDVVVYVAPTKALVNQIAAEVQARFKKNYRYAGKTLFSVFTRDYRFHNPTSCQVLVTVPHLLQIMLMTPANKHWVPKIKSIIIDEVHTISQAEDGVVYEQLLMSSPCQIIALSATIGNVDEFGHWLSASQASLNRTLTIIQHDQRYSDLRKYVFEPPEMFDLTSGLPQVTLNAPLGLEQVPSMKCVHPVACLSDQQRGIPFDLTLESRDCLMLWQTMKKHENHAYNVPNHLSPSEFFSDNVVKADVIRWGVQLKELLSKWMRYEESPFAKIISVLRINLDVVNIMGGTYVTNEGQLIRADNLLESTMPLLCDLQRNDALPAILFNYNRSACEEIVKHLLRSLEEAERSYKANNKQWKYKLEKHQVWQKNAKSREKNAQKAAKAEQKDRRGDRSELGSKQDRIRAEQESNESYATFDPDAPVEIFSFANPKKGDQEMMSRMLQSFKKVGIPEELINAFRRGIGVHHSGMNR